MTKQEQDLQDNIQRLGKALATTTEFEEELAALLNRHNRENQSNTPDFILAAYMQRCLANFEQTSRAREQWYGHTHRPGNLGSPDEHGAFAVGVTPNV